METKKVAAIVPLVLRDRMALPTRRFGSLWLWVPVPCVSERLRSLSPGSRGVGARVCCTPPEKFTMKQCELLMQAMDKDTAPRLDRCAPVRPGCADCVADRRRSDPGPVPVSGRSRAAPGGDSSGPRQGLEDHSLLAECSTLMASLVRRPEAAQAIGQRRGFQMRSRTSSHCATIRGQNGLCWLSCFCMCGLPSLRSCRLLAYIVVACELCFSFVILGGTHCRVLGRSEAHCRPNVSKSKCVCGCVLGERRSPRGCTCSWS